MFWKRIVAAVTTMFVEPVVAETPVPVPDKGTLLDRAETLLAYLKLQPSVPENLAQRVIATELVNHLKGMEPK